MEIDESGNLSDDEILPEARVFEFRAQNIFQSKLEALKELLSRKPEEFIELSNTDTEKTPEKAKKSRGRKALKGKSKGRVKDAEPENSKNTEKTPEKAKKSRGRKAREGTPIEESEEDSSPRRSRREGTPIEGSEEDSSPTRKSRRRGKRGGYSNDIPKKTRRNVKRKAQTNEKGGSVDPKELVSSINLPAASKRKIRELTLNSYRLQKRIDMENERILSACDAAEEVEQFTEDADSDQSIIVKIRFLSDISKITVKLREKFASVYHEVADMHSLLASEILLCVNDQTIKSDDTPQSLNLKYFDIIDCLPYKPSEDKVEDNSAKFLLKMQSNDTRKKINVYGSQFEKFEEFMKRYSEIRNIPMTKLSFEFDGEKIEGFETPEELDIESGSCIDVSVIKENSETAANSDSDIEVTAEFIPQSKMLQICELDSD